MPEDLRKKSEGHPAIRAQLEAQKKTFRGLALRLRYGGMTPSRLDFHNLLSLGEQALLTSEIYLGDQALKDRRHIHLRREVLASLEAVGQRVDEAEAIRDHMLKLAKNQPPPPPPAAVEDASKPDRRATADRAWEIAKGILSSAEAPPRGRGRLTALARLVATRLPGSDSDTIRKYISPSLRDWEAKNLDR